MEIEQLFIYFLLEEFGGEASQPICSLLKERNFDLRCLFEWENLSKLLPLVFAILTALQNKSPTGCAVGQDCRDTNCKYRPCLRPIASIADEKILTALDEYMA